MGRRGPRKYADDLERGTLSPPEEKMRDTDREARLPILPSIDQREIVRGISEGTRGFAGRFVEFRRRVARACMSRDMRKCVDEIDRLKAKLEGEDG